MKKLAFLFTSIALVGLPIGLAQAETCYKLNPFIDVIRLNVDANEGVLGAAHQRLTGNWIADTVYTIPVTGARELNLDSSSVRRVGLVGTNNGSLFGGNLLCGVDGIPGGAWKLQCSGGAGNFVNTGTPFAPVFCGSLPPSAPGARVAGRK